ncbi:MAG: GNAT family N-acetyltransferase [Microcoleaceae cyanobacterium MO_207.B10]|nr:GNAT family N-acetyltransferase [Microcoleaceae cyanobacterium MO_207.B10]
MSLAEILSNSFHSRRGIMGWAYPFLRLGIYEDLRTRIRSKKEQYLCLVAMVIRNTESSEELSTIEIENQDLVATVEMSVRSRNGANFISFNAWHLHSWEYVYLSNLAVDVNYRRLGIAQKLLDCCETKAIEWGFSDLYLHVLENNYTARRLYYRAGYQLEEVEWTWASLLFKQPRKLLLRKSFSGKI